MDDTDEERLVASLRRARFWVGQGEMGVIAPCGWVTRQEGNYATEGKKLGLNFTHRVEEKKSCVCV